MFVVTSVDRDTVEVSAETIDVIEKDLFLYDDEGNIVGIFAESTWVSVTKVVDEDDTDDGE